MKKEYIVPEIEVIAFDDGDVLTLSLIYRPGENATSNEHFFDFVGGSETKPGDSTDVKNIMNKTQNQ